DEWRALDSQRSTKLNGSHKPPAISFLAHCSCPLCAASSPTRRQIASNAGCWPTRWNQYFEFQKSSSRRCMIACQKLAEGVSMPWLIVCDSSRQSCNSQRPDTQQAAISASASCDPPTFDGTCA